MSGRSSPKARTHRIRLAFLTEDINAFLRIARVEIPQVHFVDSAIRTRQGSGILRFIEPSPEPPPWFVGLLEEPGWQPEWHERDGRPRLANSSYRYFEMGFGGYFQVAFTNRARWGQTAAIVPDDDPLFKTTQKQLWALLKRLSTPHVATGEIGEQRVMPPGFGLHLGREMVRWLGENPARFIDGRLRPIRLAFERFDLPVPDHVLRNEPTRLVGDAP